MLTEDDDILEVGKMCNFYEKLYTSKSIPDIELNNNIYLEGSNVNEMSNNDRDMRDAFSSLEECNKSL